MNSRASPINQSDRVLGHFAVLCQSEAPHSQRLQPSGMAFEFCGSNRHALESAFLRKPCNTREWYADSLGRSD